MKVQLKQNPWSCHLASFAMAAEMSQAELVKLIGHDGSEVVNSLEPPQCHRGFHPQELINAVWKAGWAATAFLLNPSMGNYDRSLPNITFSNETFFCDLVMEQQGVITGQAKNTWHAFAFAKGVLINPNTGKSQDFTLRGCHERGFLPREIVVLCRRHD